MLKKNLFLLALLMFTTDAFAFRQIDCWVVGISDGDTITCEKTIKSTFAGN